MLRQAIERGARLEGAGPIAGTYVVSAERARLAGPMFESGVLMLAAIPLLCGEAGR